MKHRMTFRKLGRGTKHRLSMLKNMVTSLIQHERIETTLPKAKELRRIADQVVTLAKSGDIPDRRKAQGIVRTKDAFNKLFDVFGPRYQDREGGYCRILKTTRRLGDNAEMAVIEYIDRSGELRKARPASGKASQGLKDLL